MAKKIQIAIDGPVGAGKSTVAKEVAERLGILYVDTGAMYRAVALYAKMRDVDWENEDAISNLMDDVDIVLETPVGEKKDGRKVSVYLEGEDVSWDIRKNDFGEGSSVVSQYPKVREVLVEKQQEMASNGSIIMEGRDIGTRVLPNADLKIYMDANVDERVKRKQDQLEDFGVKLKYKKVKKELMTRDNREMTREVDPLRPAKNAWVFDTTGLSIVQVVDKIIDRVAKL